MLCDFLVILLPGVYSEVFQIVSGFSSPFCDFIFTFIFATVHLFVICVLPHQVHMHVPGNSKYSMLA